MATRIITIKGRIISHEDQHGLGGLKVEAWDKDLVFNDLVGSATTDAEGNFQINFTQKYFKEVFLDRKPDLFFKIFRDNELVRSTEDHIWWNVEDANNEVLIELVDQVSTDGTTHIKLSGVVKHSNGNTIAGITVRVSEKMIRSQETLTETKTNNSGFYSTTIQLKEKNDAIITEALDEESKILATSDVVYAPTGNIAIDLIVIDDRFKGQSFFTQNATALNAYIDALVKSPQAVTVNDVQFIANQTSKEPADVWHSVKAATLQQETQIPAEAFYGLFKQGFPSSTKELLAIDPQTIGSALANAAVQNQVSDDIEKQTAQITDQWQQYVAAQSLQLKPQKMDATVSDVLSIAIADKNKQQEVMHKYVSHTGDIQSFWNDLASTTLDDQTVKRVQRTIQMSALTGNQIEMTKALMNDASQNNGSNPFLKLAEKDEEDWTNYIRELSAREGKSTVPSIIKADAEDERIAAYANTLTSALAKAYPTQAFFGRMIKDDSEQNAFSSTQHDLSTFYTNNPQFDIKSSSTILLDKEDSGFNFSGIEQKTAVIDELKAIQRLSFLSPDYKAINSLRMDGLKSSLDVMQMTQSQFVASYSGSFGSEQNATYAYKSAQKNYFDSLALYGKLGYQFNFGNTVVPASPVNPTADPTLRTMFGSLDACECEDCTSVFAAAAYYADILHFLYSRSPQVYTELVRRRPDLPHIELTCENTNTPLPYVDLVIELLENFVLTHKSPPELVPLSYQTTWQANELLANPEHLNYHAYDELKKSVFPHVLPFNFPLEETRVYLKHLGVERNKLMTDFFAGTKDEAFDDFNICMERLLISPQEAKILTGETVGNDTPDKGVWNFYGFDKESGYHPLVDPLDSGKAISGGTWVNALSNRVDVLLQQTELIYKQLLALLLCDFINPLIDGARKITIVAKTTDEDGNDVPPDTCELNLLELHGLEESDLKNIHRFLRLWRKLGWTMYELDEALLAFGTTDFTEGDLKKISQTHFLGKQLNLPVDKTSALWSDMNSVNTYVDWNKDNYPIVDSLYEKLFRNKAVLNPVDIDFTEDPQALGGNMDDHTATIFAALQTGDTDYSYLKNDTTVLANTDLSIENLSSLFRNTQLAKKLKLSVKDFLSLRSIIGIDPFADPHATYLFLEKATTVKSSGFSIDLINYLINHVYLQETAVAPDDTAISVFLSELRAALRAINTSSADDQRNTIAQKFSEQFKITTTGSALLLHTYIKSTANNAIAIEEDFRADDFSAIDFLKAYPDPTDNTKEVEPVFMRTTDVTNPLQIAVPILFDDYVKIDKIATFINKLKLSDTDIENILNSAAVIGCTDLIALPVVTTPGSFDAFEILIHLIQSRDYLPVGTPDHFDILNHAITLSNAATDPDKQAAKDLWLSDLVLRTNWDRLVIEALTGDKDTLTNAGILRTEFPKDFVNGDIVLQLRNCMNVLKKIGLNTSLIADAIAEDVDGDLSQAIKNAAKSKYDEAQWLSLAKPLRDVLRESQREALVAYTIANPSAAHHEHWKNSDELYQYLLIDIEMKPISLTSRIKQAICSVQLFIDRVLMNLEHRNADSLQPILQLDGDQADEWKEWRKLYRVWEANRKIFLYPENWLEPELRDNKSPFFKELETQLLQNELTDENVEDAFYNYLEKLDGVSRLEVVGLYHQLENATADEDSVDILHVIARTYSHPHKYYHRTFEYGEWTSWEKLEIDIDGDHIVPVIFNRRLCLFWLFFSEENLEKDSIDPKSNVGAAPRFLKIQVAWSEFKQNKWTAKKLSKTAIYSGGYTSSVEDAFAGLRQTTFVDARIESDGNLRLQLPSDYWFLLDKKLAQTNEEIKQYLLQAGFIFNDTNTDPYVDSISFGQYQQNSSTYYSNMRKFPNIPPKNTDDNNQRFKELTTENALYYDAYTKDLYYARSSSQKVLGNSGEGRYNLVVPSDYAVNPLDTEFFFQDRKNTFYVKHDLVAVPIIYEDPGKISLGDWVKDFGDNYYTYDPNPLPHDIGDPVIDPEIFFSESFEHSFLNGVTNTLIDTKGVSLNTRSVQENIATPVRFDAGATELRAFRVGTDMETRSLTTNGGFSFADDSLQVSQIVNPDYQYLDRYYSIWRYYFADRFTFFTFYHHHVKKFIRELNKNGTDGLLQRKLQVQPDSIHFSSSLVYAPTSLVTNTTEHPYPVNSVDFAYGGAYSQYNWELFFHTPMLIACRLSADQRFEEARNWFHYIFDPTNSEGGDKERFWQFYPFWQEAQNKIETLDDLLRNEAELHEQVEKWMEYPFQPHVIARMRISAYMKNVVMKYLDNLIAWGDQLFRRDTIEAINEATNLYILAAEILGERPQQIPPRATHADFTFDELKDSLDDFSEALVDIETFITPSASSSSGSGGNISSALGKMFFFCIPRNEYLLRYWDTVADRLFKIRHSMNIEGVVRTLPLFEPPIDPGMLVRAAAAGMDLSSILSDLTAPLPFYRFGFILQKANEFCNDVKALGSSLLQALEKRDAEKMALLRSEHEQKLLKAIVALKENAIDDAKASLEAAQKSLEIAQAKFEYYNARPYMNQHEQQHLMSMQLGMIFSMVQGELDTIGSTLAAIPNLKAGTPTTIGVTWGGDNLGQMMHAISQYIGILASVNNTTGTMSATLGGYDRRRDDWHFQAQTANKEIQQIERQILSSEIKLAMAEKDLANQKLQIENAAAEEDFMRTKFTNQQLYEWMIGQLSTVYFQSYQLAYDLAKKAEQCFQYETGKFGETSFVQFGYWDSLKKGLLSGEKLQYDLRRMESSYYTVNKRELELSKNISLLFLNPQALLDLKENGVCNFIVPEALYDLDFSGHYFRRIKSVSVSIPCIAGPYTTISCTLRLVKHTTRLNTDGAYEVADYSNDDRFRYITTESHSVCVTTAQNDGGLFELNFKDERYLPFEGCGAFGEWQLELNQEAELRMFDYNTISDVIINIKYTAREDAGPFKTSVSDYLKILLKDTTEASATASGTQLWRLFSLKHEFPTEWYNMLHPSNGVQQMSIKIENSRFPFFAQTRSIHINTVHVYGLPNIVQDFSVEVTSNSGAGTKQTLSLTDGDQYHDSKDVSAVNFELGNFTIKPSRADAAPIGDNDLKDLLILLEYQFD